MVTHWTLVEGVYKQLESFKEGFEAIFSLSHLAIFYPAELELLFCGGSSGERWTASRMHLKIFEVTSALLPQRPAYYIESSCFSLLQCATSVKGLGPSSERLLTRGRSCSESIRFALYNHFSNFLQRLPSPRFR